MSDGKVAEIRARHAQSEKNYIELEATWKAQVHEDRAWLLAEVERLREVIRTIRARCVELDDSDAVSETLDITSAVLEDRP